MLGCLVLMMGEMCLADNTPTNKAPTTKDEQVAELGTIKDNDHLRTWVNSIKPAAGHVEPVHQGTSYWNQSVRRENLKHLQE